MKQEETVEQTRGVLNASPYPDVRAVRCRWEGNSLVLTGTVRSYYMKQIAQSEALRVNGCQVINNVQVKHLS